MPMFSIKYIIRTYVVIITSAVAGTGPFVSDWESR